MESTTFTRDAFHITALNPLHSIGIYYPTPHAIHCIHSGCISHCCMESSAFHPTARTPMPSIGINYTKLHGIHFIQSRYIAPLCIEYTAFNHASWNPLHCIGFHCSTLHGIDCIQSCCIINGIPSGSTWPHCMESTALIRDPFPHAAWNPLHSIVFHCAELHGIH